MSERPLDICGNEIPPCDKEAWAFWHGKPDPKLGMSGGWGWVVVARQGEIPDWLDDPNRVARLVPEDRVKKLEAELKTAREEADSGGDFRSKGEE